MGKTRSNGYFVFFTLSQNDRIIRDVFTNTDRREMFGRRVDVT